MTHEYYNNGQWVKLIGSYQAVTTIKRKNGKVVEQVTVFGDRFIESILDLVGYQEKKD